MVVLVLEVVKVVVYLVEVVVLVVCCSNSLVVEDHPSCETLEVA
jgi:hypothetical protein